MNKLCACGCGQELKLRKREGLKNFKGRKYFSYQCAMKEQKGVSKPKVNIYETNIHKCVDKFLYGRVA